MDESNYFGFYYIIPLMMETAIKFSDKLNVCMDEGKYLFRLYYIIPHMMEATVGHSGLRRDVSKYVYLPQAKPE